MVPIRDGRNDVPVLAEDRPLRACFIIAPHGTKLEPLTRIVRDEGWRVLNIESVEPGATVFLDTTAQLISAADAVIVVLTERDSSNTLVETGVALGVGRPVLLIADDAAILDGLVPDRILGSLPRVRAKLLDSEALGLHVGAFLNGVERIPLNSPPGSARPRASTQPSTGRTRSTTGRMSGLEERLLNAFEGASEIEAVHLEPQLDGSRQFRPDFAVWIRDAHPALPNPVIVELVGHGAVLRGSSQRRLDQLLSYSLATGVAAVMLVEEVDDQPLSLLRLGPMIYRVGLVDLEVLLREATLVPKMVLARNFLAHSAG